MKIKTKDYQQLFAKNRKIFSKYYVIYYGEYDLLVVKTAAKKKTGKAVVRNFLKRRVKEILTRLISEMGAKNLLVLAIVINKHNLTYGEEIQYIKQLLQPIEKRFAFK